MSWIRKTLCVVCAITVLSSSEPRIAVADQCAVTDLPCFQLELLDSLDTIASLNKRLVLKDREISLAQQGQDLLLQQRNLAQEALKSLSSAAASLAPHWYEHPALWLSMGIVGGILLTVLAGLAIGQAALALRSSLL